MKHDCENIPIRKSWRHTYDIQRNIIKNYFAAIGNVTYSEHAGGPMCFGVRCKQNTIVSFLFDPTYEKHGELRSYTHKDVHMITAECDSAFALDSMKGLCVVLNNGMPDDVVWEFNVVDNTYTGNLK